MLEGVGGVSYRAQASLYVVCTYVRVVQPSDLLTGGVVVILADVAAVPGVRWDARRWALVASKSGRVTTESCPQKGG